MIGIERPTSMTRKNDDKTGKAPWQRPELVRLGTIRDIAGPPVPFAQSAGNKHS